MTSFGELLAMLPRGDEFKLKAPVPGLSSVSGSNQSFVEPDLSAARPIVQGETSVVLLSASGAVGKSTLAAELAYRLGAPLWDVSKLLVGSQTYSGAVSTAYGFEAPGQLKRLRDGRALIVIDALDEAHVRAGTPNFDAFLADLATELKDPREKPTFVLLARTETADIVDVTFGYFSVPFARYDISYFHHDQAMEFIDKRLDRLCHSKGTPLTHQQQRIPYMDAREALFSLVYRIFALDAQVAWDDRRVRDFLGYAPVLETLSDYLYYNVTNYMALRTEIVEEVAGSRDPWQFLTEVVTRIQSRETQKFLHNSRPDLQPLAEASGWSDWQKLFRPEEQCARILALVLRHPAPSVELDLPRGLAIAYEEKLRNQLPTHPFLAGNDFANGVFREYAYAFGITRGRPEVVQALRTRMTQRTNPFLPSRLYSWFVLRLAGDDSAVLDGEDLGLFLEGVHSGDPGVALEVVTAAEGTYEAILVSSSKQGKETRLIVLDTGSGLRFWRRLSGADIDVLGDVTLGLPEHSFILGPSVELRCSNLKIGCSSIDVLTRNGGVRLVAQSYAAATTNLNLRVRDEGTAPFDVDWPEISYPWFPYRSQATPGAAPLEQSPRGEILRKLLMMFRRQRTRALSTLRGARWAPEQQDIRDGLLQLATKRGVLSYVERRALVKFESDYDSLMSLVERQPDLSPKAQAFLAEFLGAEEADRVIGR